jgi:hypothetical protein
VPKVAQQRQPWNSNHKKKNMIWFMFEHESFVPNGQATFSAENNLASKSHGGKVKGLKKKTL